MVKVWDYKRLPEVLRNGKDGIKIGPFGSQLKKEFLQSGGQYRVYGQENVYVDDFHIGTRYLSTERFRDLSSCELLPGDIVISTMGTIGKCSIVPEYIKPGIMDSHLVRLRTDSTIDKPYFRYYIQSKLVQRQIKDLSVGGIMDGLSTTIIRQLEVAVPSLPEQRAIAAALSDTDAYIAALEKLIAKKRAVKQGAMQELLTGKRRLPGFSGEWVEKTLSRVLKVGYGKNQHKIEVASGKYPILATSGEIGRTNTFLYDQPSVLIGRKGTIDKPQYMNTPFWTIDTLFYTIIDEVASSKYLYYLFCNIDWANLNEASGVPSLSAGIIEKLGVYMPDEKNEQTAIAEVLSAMDAEIDALKAKLDKAKHIKQGMMSELLTGRIRLMEQERRHNCDE